MYEIVPDTKRKLYLVINRIVADNDTDIGNVKCNSIAPFHWMVMSFRCHIYVDSLVGGEIGAVRCDSNCIAGTQTHTATHADVLFNNQTFALCADIWLVLFFLAIAVYGTSFHGFWIFAVQSSKYIKMKNKDPICEWLRVCVCVYVLSSCKAENNAGNDAKWKREPSSGHAV